MLNGGIFLEAAMDIIDHPDAQPLLQDAQLSASAVHSCTDSLTTFIQRYLPCFYREEHRHHARTILQGKLSGLQRKTTEPIATQARQKRRPLQLFVGGGGWDDDAVLDELRRHVAAELGDEDAVFILDPSAFPKKGNQSCGVARQWCGCLGKVENCQKGVFVAYAAKRGFTLVDRRLYLPQERAHDDAHRAKTYVPDEVTFLEAWRIGLELLDGVRAVLPGRWVVADDELGRCTEFRGNLRLRRLRYVLDVPCSTLVRDPQERQAPSRPGGKPRLMPFERVDQWVARQPAGRWRTVTVRDGEKGPMQVKVLLATVQTREEDGQVGPLERLAVLRSCAKKPETWYTLSNARQAKRYEIARVHGTRHRVEELLEAGKQEVGMGHYEVRSWVGWHHHMTLSLLALWFLQLEKLRLGKKNASGDGAAGAGDLHGAAAGAERECGADRGGGQRGTAA
jgi:SRSO17 transposase